MLQRELPEAGRVISCRIDERFETNGFDGLASRPFNS
jgi:hypothetical protein